MNFKRPSPNHEIFGNINFHILNMFSEFRSANLHLFHFSPYIYISQPYSSATTITLAFSIRTNITITIKSPLQKQHVRVATNTNQPPPTAAPTSPLPGEIAGVEVYIIGTAHISAQSAADVEDVTLWWCQNSYWTWPIYSWFIMIHLLKMVVFHGYVKFPEGK